MPFLWHCARCPGRWRKIHGRPCSMETGPVPDLLAHSSQRSGSKSGPHRSHHQTRWKMWSGSWRCRGRTVCLSLCCLKIQLYFILLQCHCYNTQAGYEWSRSNRAESHNHTNQRVRIRFRCTAIFGHVTCINIWLLLVIIINIKSLADKSGSKFGYVRDAYLL